MSEMYQLTLRDYVSMVRRRGWISAAIFSIVLTTGLVITMLIPPVFQSTGTIVIESQQVPVDLVQATVTSFADERIEVIKQRVMTRENLLQIIEKYSLFKSPEFEGSKITPSEMIDQMRRQIQVILVNANVQNRGSKGTSGTIAFKVVVENRHPELAQRVANELVTLFLDANVKVRTERASQTTVFLTQEATKLKTDLEALEAQIAGYKSENGAALPENVAVNTNSIERMESDLRALEAESRSANEELRALELELSGAKAGVGAGGTNQARSPEEELRVAKSELSRLAALYTDNHPDVRAARRKVEALERSAPQTSSSGSGIQNTGDMQVARIENRISSARGRIKLISQQQSTIRSRMSTAEQQLLKAPQVERGLSALTRDYQNAQKKYDEIRAKQMTAQVAENMEDDQKAERFTLLEPPLLADKPVRPDRGKLGAMSFFLALAAAAGVVFALETVSGTVRGMDALALVVGQQPLVSIPYIEIQSEVVQRNRYMKYGVMAGAAGLLALLLLLHFAVMPLDILFYKLLNRLS
jgi:succinoglycan biosynthesis transport protein ExoP